MKDEILYIVTILVVTFVPYLTLLLLGRMWINTHAIETLLLLFGELGSIIIAYLLIDTRLERRY